MSGFVGVFGRPYLDLEHYVDVSRFSAVHEEICLALPRLETGYTGGSLRSMGVAAPRELAAPYRDYGHVIDALDDAAWLRFASLADEPRRFPLARRRQLRFGDETDAPLTRAQELWLEYRMGVYFPWQVVFHLVENRRWEDNHDGTGKGFSPDAVQHLPQTVALVRSLPFTEIGRCLIFGLRADHHATLHRDTDPASGAPIAQSMSLCPAANKRFYLEDDAGERCHVRSRAYWFNDADWHGVEPDPFFRYSLRVDGRFEPSFLARLEADHGT